MNVRWNPSGKYTSRFSREQKRLVRGADLTMAALCGIAGALALGVPVVGQAALIESEPVAVSCSTEIVSAKVSEAEVSSCSNTGPDTVGTDTVARGGAQDGEGEQSICGEDDRDPSNDPRAGRLRYRKKDTDCEEKKVCTAFLFDDRPNSALTAGHCCAFMDFACESKPVLEFNVPASSPGGAPQDSLDEDRYEVEELLPSGEQFSYLGDGRDWCVIGVKDNDIDPFLSPLAAQGASYQLAETVPDDYQSTLRITGYGVHGVPPEDPPDSLNHTQQTDSGPYVGLVDVGPHTTNTRDTSSTWWTRRVATPARRSNTCPTVWCTPFTRPAGARGPLGQTEGLRLIIETCRTRWPASRA